MDANRWKLQRERMVERQIAARGVHDPRVLAAMRTVPREEFVGAGVRDQAYADSPLPIDEGQTISQPYIVALMAEAAGLSPRDRVLEIGAGSGYAAAVLGAVAGQVYAIERHPSLAAQAGERLARLGYANVQVRAGDGSGGWPEAAPFDAILAAAGGPDVPDVLLQQLAVGGSLVMPVGGRQHAQQLVKVTRVGEHRFERQDLGAVRFVPLVGEHGWTDDAASAEHGRATTAARAQSLPERIRAAAEPLPPLESPAFGGLFDRYADARVVLLGEASHGTDEFYAARAAITRRLIEAHGFNVVAVEADWPDAAVIDRFVRGRDPRGDAEPAFRRFPTWMWRNTQVQAFVQWLRAHNGEREPGQRASFHGLDIYNLHASMRAVIDYLESVDPSAAKVARERYGCLSPWSTDPAAYGRHAFHAGYARCEAPVLAMLRDLLARQLRYAQDDPDSFLDAAQNARLVASAEEYYRTMYQGAAASWNLRDTHMFETLEHLLAARGPGTKVVVWAHNSHIGDARHTAMGRERGELNLGQLCRQRHGAHARLVGFGTHTGTVAAADDWDEPMQVMTVRPSLPESIEAQAHAAQVPRFLLDLDLARAPDLRAQLLAPRLQRFIGVIYRPQTERWSHYAEAELARQYDGWVWFDRTSAVTPLAGGDDKIGDDTWPFGL
jgi:protein-L-isoaspartate(D-aspartate) O-methyltransferase